MADCHIGGWHDPKLRQLGIDSFRKAIDICLQEHVAFVLIAGDLFNTALPSIDLIKETASILNKLKEHDIECYIIPGSHDFSPSGKTMLDVLEKAGLVHNVVRFKDNKLIFTEDKTGVKITGIMGLKAGLEKEKYKVLNKEELANEPGFKIFMFHTGIDEFKPKDLEKVEMQSIVSLPKNFNYYAGGHIHYIFNQKKENYGLIVYPGALFPNNFAELEKYHHGSFFIINDQLETKQIEVKLKEVVKFDINVDNLSAHEAEVKILSELNQEVTDKIVLLRISGVLESGKISDINFKVILDKLKSAYTILKNTNKLTTKEIQELEIETGNVDDVESKLIQKQEDKTYSEELIKHLMEILSLEKNEGEKKYDFENRLEKEVVKVLNLEGCYNAR